MTVDRPKMDALAPLLAVGQVLLIRRRSILGWLIRRVTGSPYSHTALIDRTESGVWITVEAADAEGVKARRLAEYLYDPAVYGILIRDAALAPSERAAILSVAWLRVGAKYDMGQLLGIYVRRRLPWLFGGPSKALARNRLDDQGKLICSELVTIAYRDGAAIALAPENVAVGNVDPGHLARAPQLSTVWAWGTE